MKFLLNSVGKQRRSLKLCKRFMEVTLSRNLPFVPESDDLKRLKETSKAIDKGKITSGISERNIAAVRKLVEKNRLVTVKIIGIEVRVPSGSAYTVLSNSFKLSRAE